MIHRKQILLLLVTFLTPSVVVGTAAECPGNSMAAHFYSLKSSQMAISLFINHSGPYDFIVDTGAEMTVMDTEIAKDLKLTSWGSTGLVTMVSDGVVGLVKVSSVEAGPVTVHDLPVLLEGLDQIHMLSASVRGILGENFLGRFDLLIDYKHKVICFDESRSMQREMQGERVPIIQRQESSGYLAYTQPLDVTAHIQDDGKKGTVLRVDSGAIHPMLFRSRRASPSWLHRNWSRQSMMLTNGGALAFVTIPEQKVRIGSQTTRLIKFVTPFITVSRRMLRDEEDGLLPTKLFNKVFISYADHFVMFDPR